ncbi:MAG: disulfide bond formation protein DsbC [Candidatus Contendobacter odensis]|uniref:Thiol:disulfide interchange protein n=1 Tax=Candidatus Contendibacter odensensis TaxID=1400860 RepID=A0A2G6PF81_9GAMM|nr:MAG: disulfide bond formation protein DsbC [Candidatus Contendobacter odensis]
MHKITLITALLCSTTVLAAEQATPTTAADQPDSSKLQAALGGPKPDSITPITSLGLYEVIINGQIFYINKQGNYAIQGDVLNLDTRENLTENRRNTLRSDAVNTIGEGNMVVFAPSENPVKHTVTVFTDIDCGYCRKMHNQIAEYNKEGIKIRYLLFPRAGIGSESFKKSVSVWCADDRQAALTQAKSGQPVDPKTCQDPVQAQFELGRKLGVRGTPTMILENGIMIPGYVPPTRLAALLAQDSENASNAKNNP